MAAVALVIAVAPDDADAQPSQPGPASPGLARLIPPSPAPASFIADVPRVLDAAAHARLDARIDAVQDSGLADIAIAILPSIGDYEPYEAGVAIYRAWGIGRRDSLGSARRDLGVLLLIVPKEIAPDSIGHCWITTGLGAEGIITDGEGGEICREHIIPHLRERDYARALAAGIEGIVARMRADAGLAARTAVPVQPDPLARTRKGFVATLVAGGGLFVTMLVAFAIWYRRHGPKTCPKCRQRMHRLTEQEDDAPLGAAQLVEERIGSVDYDVWRCSCGEQLIRPHRALFSRYHPCPACGARAARTTRRVIDEPDYVSTGLAEDTETCEHCPRIDVRQVVLPRRTPPSESRGGGGRGGGGRGGGGGRSFGGSGRTSGGGGGGRY